MLKCTHLVYSLTLTLSLGKLTMSYHGLELVRVHDPKGTALRTFRSGLGVSWIGVSWLGVGWIGVGWIAVGRIVVCWVGLGWIGEVGSALHTPRDNRVGLWVGHLVRVRVRVSVRVRVRVRVRSRVRSMVSGEG